MVKHKENLFTILNIVVFIFISGYILLAIKNPLNRDIRSKRGSGKMMNDKEIKSEVILENKQGLAKSIE
ncbi:hypothetical protein SAMN04489864_10169 [Pedobacter insulae]|uniref:Uncharacterized protein n=1 Tax=Pedobacter insulae TaxID=414048 RepID=A0A1I2SX85_9SPHI|nr:hypothetical protein SAMN04489864_10169 [Pedobacter insulae]